ncbi:MAG: hypothetical protein JXR73_02180 [Candidatus Omnitrophica bacterium]|nr:hypothetical protein [Candidatus Omnitrophota bacterium]
MIEMLLKEVEYKPDEIKKLSKKMYGKSIIALIVWPIVGLCTGYFVAPMLVLNQPLMTGIGTAIGCLYGSLRSVRFKLQAQLALCMHQIEINSRPND